MSVNPSKQFLEDLLPYLERLDARIGAVVQLLKEKGMTTDEEFAARVNRADLGSEVRDRGLRVRMEHLFSVAATDNSKGESDQ
jgi:hypothetical protein